MKYDFDEIIPRRGTNSVKWDLATDERVLPMWVADMDFRAAPPVLDALERRLRHGVFGYTKVPDAYFEAVKGWFGKRHGFRIENEWILPTTGVIPALSVILKALTEPGDKVILQTPVYNCFFAVLERTGRQPLANPLIDEGGAYRMDFEDLERKAADPQAKLIFLCNPHNPAGRAWTAEELTRLGEICLRHGVTVISDEIHCDLTLDGHRHIPFASLNEEFLRHSVTCTAPSKTFNIAGLQAANIIAADPEIRRKIDRQLVDNELHALNAFAVEALIAAYNGDTLAATSAFDKYVAPDIARIALVDFDNDCVGTTLQVARKLGRKLAGVRLDTSGTMVDKSLLSQMGMFKPTGVCKELVHNVRTALDAEGFDYVKIIVSGGFDAERIKEFEALKVPVDTYAVGSSLFDGNINFTADIVMVDGKVCAKAGRVHLPNPRLELVK